MRKPNYLTFSSTDYNKKGNQQLNYENEPKSLLKINIFYIKKFSILLALRESIYYKITSKGICSLFKKIENWLVKFSTICILYFFFLTKSILWNANKQVLIKKYISFFFLKKEDFAM
jgi:hypothetical protein